jgi:type IV pilus assembly protein PilE
MDKRLLGTATAKRRMLGITLLELMIVVVVVGILGMIAVPSYRQYVMRSQRTEAKNALLQIQANQERFYLTNRTYSADPTQLGIAGGITERGAYLITIASANLAVGYTATATPRAGGQINMQADAQCTTFTIDQQSVRAATGSAAATCW